MKKYYLATVEVQYDGKETNEKFVFSDTTGTDPQKLATDILRESLNDPDGDEWQESTYDANKFESSDTTLKHVETVIEIPAIDYVVLKKYL